MMLEKITCRKCQSLSVERRPFAFEEATPQYAPDRLFQMSHIFLDLRVDPRSHRFDGKVTHTLEARASDITQLTFDQVDLNILAVEVDKKKVSFRVHDQKLTIDLDKAPRAGKKLMCTVTYEADHPKRGMYFVGPLGTEPEPTQSWTQGQDEDSRYWFPTLDYPNQKATSEIRVTVPSGFTAISNGALISKKNVKGSTQFHYRLGTPHVTYLISLVVGRFTEIKDQGPRGLPVLYYSPQGREADAKRSFGNTPKMIEAFERKTGVPYPYEKYSQVAVHHFIFGGMENTSATTQTDLTLHDEVAHLDYTSDPLVSHELAHQWFGDLVTCRDWSHGWLNEGFATFMERVWIEERKGSDGGLEEGKYYAYQHLKDYLAQDQGDYRRSIVCNTYVDPINLFDAHFYQKGGEVLHLIRSILGDEPFWKSIRLYLTRHAGQNVETIDLIRAIEDSTGRNLRKVFDQWIFQAGHPEFEVKFKWHENKKLIEWVIEQKQTKGAPFVHHNGFTTPLFHLSVPLEMTFGNPSGKGKSFTVRETVDIQEAKERFFFPADRAPLMVRFDPNATIPKTLRFPRSQEMLKYQLENDPDCMGRIEAILELKALGDPKCVSVLGKTVRKDPFWGVGREAALALGELKSEAAKKELLGSLKVLHPKVRRAVAAALGRFRDETCAAALKTLAENDTSYFVQADATYAWAVSHLKPYVEKTDLEEVEQFLISQSQKSSYRDVICSASFRALVELPYVKKGESALAIQALIEASRVGHPIDKRVTAIRGLGKIMGGCSPMEKQSLVQVFSDLICEDGFLIRSHLIPALEQTGSLEVLPLLAQIERREIDGRVKREARRATDRLMASQKSPDSLFELKNAFEKLEKDHQKLKSQMEEMSASTEKRTKLSGIKGSRSKKRG